MARPQEQNEPEHAGVPGGHSIWWKWTASATGIASATVIGDNFFTLLAVYTLAPPFGLSVIANTDLEPTFDFSRVSFNAISGTTYYLAVDGGYGQAGALTLTISP